MSLHVMVIPEDHKNDQYMLQPIIKAMLAFVGKPNAVVRVCAVPNMEGIGQARRWARIREVMDRYSMIDLFILCVDRDGDENLRDALDSLEESARQDPEITKPLAAENAWQEIEAWVLVGQRKRPKGWTIQAIRAERDVKEMYFEKLAKEIGLTRAVGGGRRELAEIAAKNYKSLRNRCKEDVLALEAKIAQLV